MAYNKAKEVKKWVRWKEAKEKRLRELVVEEATIQELREEDWKEFNSDRRFYQRLVPDRTYIESAEDESDPPAILDVEEFLSNVENPQLFQVLIHVSKLTLCIALLRAGGLTTHEIAALLGITEKAIYRRMDRLKKKLKKFSQ